MDLAPRPNGKSTDFPAPLPEVMGDLGERGGSPAPRPARAWWWPVHADLGLPSHFLCTALEVETWTLLHIVDTEACRVQ